MTKPTDGIVSSWLRAETPEHLDLLTTLRKKLSDTIHSEVTDAGTPNRDWCRGFQRYQNGYQMLLVEERERAKLHLMAKRMGENAPLTDEEYEREMRELGLEAVKDLPTADLAIELASRGLSMPTVGDERGDPD